MSSMQFLGMFISVVLIGTTAMFGIAAILQGIDRGDTWAKWAGWALLAAVCTFAIFAWVGVFG